MVYLVSVLIITVGAYWFVALPLMITDYTQGYYDTIDQLPEDSYVVWGYTMYTVYVYNEGFSASVAATKQMLEGGAKIIFFTSREEEVTWKQEMIRDALGLDTFEQIQQDPRYGTQIVDIGFAPGDAETVFKSMFESFTAVKSTDIYGNSLTDYNTLPLMEGITGGSEADLVISARPELALSVAGPGAKILIGPLSTGDLSVSLPYWRSGDIDGQICGLRSAAEYEKLTGYLGAATQSLFQSTAMTAFTVLGIIAGSIHYLYKRMTGTVEVSE
jgi:hypothetical protein